MRPCGEVFSRPAPRHRPVRPLTSRRCNDVVGPDLPFASWPSAAAQLHQTGHSSIVQHFRRVKVGRAGRSGRSSTSSLLKTAVRAWPKSRPFGSAFHLGLEQDRRRNSSMCRSDHVFQQRETQQRPTSHSGDNVHSRPQEETRRYLRAPAASRRRSRQERVLPSEQPQAHRLGHANACEKMTRRASTLRGSLRGASDRTNPILRDRCSHPAAQRKVPQHRVLYGSVTLLG